MTSPLGMAFFAAAALASTGPSAEAKPPARLVTIGGAVTNIVQRLGHGDAIVGIDSTSTSVELPGDPAELGFFRRVSVSGVLSLRPSHVLAVEETGPPALFDALASAGVEVTKVPTPNTVDGAAARIARLAEALGEAERGEEMVERLRRDLASVQRPDAEPSVLFVYARGPGTLLVAGKDTGADAVIRLAGGRNAVDGVDGFKPFSSEAVLQAAPQMVLMTDGGLASMGGADGLRAHPILGKTPAVRSGRIISMDDLRLLGFGPELGAVVGELARRLSES